MATYNVANYSGHKNEHLDGGGGQGGNVRAHAKNSSAPLTAHAHTHTHTMKAQINYLTKIKSVNVLVLHLAICTNSTQHSIDYNHKQ